MNDALARVAALPCFRDPQDIQALDGGITNVNLTVRDADRRYVVRLGADIEEHGVMRWNELALSRAAEAAGVSPGVVYHAPGVLVLDFIDAKTYAEEDVRDPANLPKIIHLVAQAHRGLGAHLTGPILTFWPFQVVQTYAARLKADGSRYQTALPDLLAAATALEAATGPVELVVGHNDLLAANVLDDGERLWLIDWEYGGFNTPLFDLAGLAGNNGLTEAQERAMLEQYFDAPPNAHWRPYQAMKCISLMRETLWSMTSELHSELDFDYSAYTAENLARLQAAMADFRNS
jgi:thiamine kinase-like enzyme